MVKLIHRTEESEKLIAFMARVSSPNQENPKFEKLIKYLLDNKHFSPFEMCNMCVEINTSRAIAQQLIRHRSFAYQEFSQRYQQVSSQSFEQYEARRQDVKNRQNSISDLPEDVQDWFKNAQYEINTSASELYQQALDKGIAKESARFLLPLSTSTKLYMNGSLRSWIHYIEVRTDSSTQKEHRDIAEECKEIFKKEFPIIAKALCW